MPVTIYHNPRCSKSRKTLEILRNAGESPEIVHYLEVPPGGARIVELAGMIGVPVRELLRQGEDEYRRAEDLPPLDDDAALADWISRHPRVLQRPIVVDDERGRAVVGRPPENVESLLTP